MSANLLHFFWVYIVFMGAVVPSCLYAVVDDVLENGLRFIVAEHHTAPVASLRIYVKTGSIFEQDYLGSGISHFFEHLINGGTTSTHSEEEINDWIDQLGGANNAYTTKDHTCYFVTTSADKIHDAIDLMSDWMLNSTFPEKEFQREKGVVLEELFKGREEPYRILDKLLYETMFTTHPVHYPVIGYENLIRAIKHEDILRYYQRMYVPNNMIVVAVGDFNEDTVAHTIRKQFKGLKRRFLPSISLPSEPQQLGKRMRVIEKEGLGEAYLRIGFHTVPIHHPDLYALDVLSYILSRGRSSRLIKLLREEKSLVSHIRTYSHTPSYNAGVFGITATCKGENIDGVSQEIFAQLQKIKSDSVTEAEVQKAIKQKIAEDIRGGQTASDRASEFGINLLTTGNPNFNATYIRGIKRVSPEDISRVAQKYFTASNKTTIIMRSERLKSSSQPDKSSQHTVYPVECIQLENGLRVLIKENHDAPIVNIQALFLGGVLYEGKQEGISHITAAMLTRGNRSMTKTDIANTFDRMGGSFSSSSGNNTLGLKAEVLSEDISVALSILADSIQHPTFPESELETVRSTVLSAIARRRDQWNRELSYLFRQQYFADHPYKNDRWGSAKTVKNITLDQVRSFYHNTVIPQRGVITIFGDITLEQARKEVTQAFDNFAREEVDLPIPSPYISPQQNRTVVEKTKRNLSAVFLGYPGISITNTEDRFPLIVLDTVLSGYGYPGGWLQEHLRGGDRDYVYVVHAFQMMGIDPGYFGIMAASSPEKLDKVIAIILQDVEQIRQNYVTEAELEKAKVICVTMDKLGRQTNADISLQAATDELYGLGYTFSDSFAARIQQVTADDVLRVAKKYLTNRIMVKMIPGIRE